jgi:hypothetical protein
VVFYLSCDEWEKSDESCALDRNRELALVFGCDAGFLARNHASVRIQKLLQDRDVFVVDVLDIIFGEETFC